MAVACQTEDDYYKDKPLFDFLIDNFDEHTPEGEKSGVSEAEVYSTMVELEVQFVEKDAADYGLFIEFLVWTKDMQKDMWKKTWNDGSKHELYHAATAWLQNGGESAQCALNTRRHMLT